MTRARSSSAARRAAASSRSPRWRTFYEKLVADKSEEIGIAHADDAAGAQFLLDALRQRGFTGECLTVCYEPVTGSHVGPGTVALFFQGIHR